MQMLSSKIIYKRAKEIRDLGHKNKTKYFKSIEEINNSLALKELSMGMSNDYDKAVYNGATYIRIGSKIFGKRSNKS